MEFKRKYADQQMIEHGFGTRVVFSLNWGSDLVGWEIFFIFDNPGTPVETRIISHKGYDTYTEAERFGTSDGSACWQWKKDKGVVAFYPEFATLADLLDFYKSQQDDRMDSLDKLVQAYATPDNNEEE